MNKRTVLVLVALWGLLVAVSLICRPPLPIDETRYLSVAWEMWQSDNWLVPQVNGIPYSHKPPLFFYLINLGWLLFGVNSLSARLTAPLFALANFFLTARLGRQLWPEKPQVAAYAPFILLALPLWAISSTLTMFDQLLTFFVLLGLLGIRRLSRGESGSGFLLVMIGIGGGILSKGPVVFLPLLPPALGAAWWQPEKKGFRKARAYLLLLGAILGGIALALDWALPAARAGGPAYADAILWGQTAGRMVKSFAHQRPWWWYLPFLPILLLPWTCLFFQVRKPAWQQILSEPGFRFCLVWLLPALVLFSLVSGKQLHYLTPLLPALGLIGARLAAVITVGNLRWPQRLAGSLTLLLGNLWLIASFTPYLPLVHNYLGRPAAGWGIALMAVGIWTWRWRTEIPRSGILATSTIMILLLCLLTAGLTEPIKITFDLGPIARQLGQMQDEGRPTAIYPAKYANQFHFPGRLHQSLTALDEVSEVKDWCRANPTGYIVLFRKRIPLTPHALKPVLSITGLKKPTSLWRAGDLAEEIAD